MSERIEYLQKLKTFCYFFIVVSIFSAGFLYAEKNPDIKIRVTTDKKDAMYKINEKTTFKIEALFKEDYMKEGSINVVISLDGGKKVFFNKNYLLTDENPIFVSSSLDISGFLRCDVKYEKDREKYIGCAASVYEPEKLVSFTPEPDDFEKFWEDGRKELNKIPMDVQLEPVSSDVNQESFMISFANLDNTRIYGYLSVPKKVKPPFPAYMHIASAGIGVPSQPETSYAASKGVIVLSMSVHDLKLGLSKEEYTEMSKDKKNKLFGYQFAKSPDREKFYFRNVILGLDRAIEYIYTRPDFDKKHFVVYGGSQGGGLTLVMTGFNKKITAAVARVPGLCDHWGNKSGRRAGWPRIVDYRANSNENEDAYYEMAKYYDAVHFAKRIKVPIIMEIGFIDEVIAPGSMYCGYNVITSPKKVVNAPLNGHFNMSEEMKDLMEKWIFGHLGISEKIEPY
jgi:cephalosporin-C deacetylase-like acetyl esterase